MAEFIFTSKLFSGFMRFAYDDQGVLQKFENNASIDTKQLLFLQRNFPFAIQDLERIKGKSGKIEENVDITFDNFWNRYGYKKGKVNTQVAWNKLSDAAKWKAIIYIPKYIYECKTAGHEMLYPERYLKYRRFDDE
jgi:gamma-glutamylcyclotransferase (GGCT)/AIG2-like uncharacterized protein YtfP